MTTTDTGAYRLGEFHPFSVEGKRVLYLVTIHIPEFLRVLAERKALS
jgi:hypothetical protein